ncbi:MAG: hypothetical protein GKR91_03490 [Pseudomonadales bacterium]|nr:hypothetical protein [Pseudomonadales bacterium]
MQLIDDLLEEDELACVLRGHIHIENRLDQYLSKTATNKQFIEKANLQFSQKVSLAIAYGLSEWLSSPLSYIGNLRNGFAHNLDKKLGKQEIENFYKAFPGKEKDLIQKTVSKSNKKFQLADLPFKEMPLIDQFRLCAMSLEAAIRVDAQKVR